ncbi:HD-GYP domain-containing protein [Paenibacillus tepidiphilus]|uniref:HD-GYP domain-containing protein n=1 Tax=Paenibacillus tepidiphilus TaxID=2608683 RepID=UPI00123ACEEF|nr:HD domain-containing phosphohydrolase [Paenibacillus tepidiphilus]
METVLAGSWNLYHKLMSQYDDDSIWIKGNALFRALECRCTATAEHSLVVAYRSYQLSSKSPQTYKIRNLIFLAGLLHDIGKLSMADDVLKSARKISTQMDFEHLVNHVTHGVDLLNKLNFPREIIEFCQFHHERLNGSGYPNALSDLSWIGKIAAVADVYSALKLPRLYRPDIMSDAQILAFFKAQPGAFDPQIILSLEEILISSTQNNSHDELLIEEVNSHVLG